MKTTHILFAACVLALGACSTDDPSPWGPGMDNNFPGGGSQGGGSADAQGNDLNFDFDLNASDDADFLNYKETIPDNENDPDYEDFVQNESFKNIIKINYNGNSATHDNTSSDIIVDVNGADVVVTTTKKAEFILSGNATEGSFRIKALDVKDDNKKTKVTLDNLTLSSSKQAPINIQTGKRCYLVVEGDNKINGNCTTTIDNEDMKGAIFSEGKLLISGNGTLNVAEGTKHGIVSDDYVFFHAGTTINIKSAKDGVHANDSVVIAGANITIEAGTDGIDSEGGFVMKGGVARASVSSAGDKGFKSDRDMMLLGGRIVAVTSGGVDTSDSSNPKGCAGIKCDGNLTIDGATVQMKSSGQGGKGISADGNIAIESGLVQIITTGTMYGSSSNNFGGGGPGGMGPGGMGNSNSGNTVSPKGIRSDKDIVINGGTIQVMTTGGTNSEGIESKANLTVNDGTIEVFAYDDAMNASTSISINGGKIYCYSSGNDAIDSNGKLNLNGGIIIASGSAAPEEGFDTDNSRNFSISGGTLIGTGGAAITPATASQTYYALKSNVTKGTLITVLDASGNHAFSYYAPRSYSAALLSCRQMNNGYSIYQGGSVSGGSTFHNMTIGGSFNTSGASKIK